jgi:hypothetical protein
VVVDAFAGDARVVGQRRGVIVSPFQRISRNARVIFRPVAVRRLSVLRRRPSRKRGVLTVVRC